MLSPVLSLNPARPDNVGEGYGSIICAQLVPNRPGASCRSVLSKSYARVRDERRHHLVR